MQTVISRETTSLRARKVTYFCVHKSLFFFPSKCTTLKTCTYIYTVIPGLSYSGLSSWSFPRYCPLLSCVCPTWPGCCRPNPRSRLKWPAAPRSPNPGSVRPSSRDGLGTHAVSRQSFVEHSHIKYNAVTYEHTMRPGSRWWICMGDGKAV